MCETLQINNIQLTSRFSRKEEAIIQTQHIINNRYITVYGIGLGDAIVTLINNEKVKSIRVVVLNLDVLLMSLSYVDHSTWLSNNKIILETWHHSDMVKKPFIANPSELILCDDNAAALRDRIEQELNSTFINEKFKHSPNLIINEKFSEKSKSISKLNKTDKRKIFIAASGPTLESHIEYLQKNDCYIIALDASVKTLLSHNIIPAIIISIDPNSYQLFSDISAKALNDISLVFFPNVQPELLSFWPSKCYCSFSRSPMYEQYKPVENKISLFSGGSVIHPAVDLAIYLQAKEIILLGADFSFTRNKSHSQVKDEKYSTLLPVDIAKYWVKNHNGIKVPTMMSFTGYLRDLETFISKHPDINFLNGSTEGAKIAGTTLWMK